MSKGVDSIRIKGQAIQDLPLGQGNQAKEQLPLAIEAERLANIETVNAEYPKHRIDYLVSRINECEENKLRIRNTINEQNTMISEYKGHIGMCKHRDKEIDRLRNGTDGNLMEFSMEELELKIKALFKQFPPYNVEAMEQQIIQCGEAIERCDKVIEQEDKSIKEFSEVLSLCKQRDRELAKYGAVAEGS